MVTFSYLNHTQNWSWETRGKKLVSNFLSKQPPLTASNTIISDGEPLYKLQEMLHFLFTHLMLSQHFSFDNEILKD